MNILYGRWSENLNGLSLRKIKNKIILVNNTEERIVLSPMMVTDGKTYDEIAADPGQIICFINKNKDPLVDYPYDTSFNVYRQNNDKESWVVVGYEMEIIRWIDFYFYYPHMAPGLIDITKDGIAIMGVPVGVEILASYSLLVKGKLQEILLNRNISDEEKWRITDMFLTSFTLMKEFN